MQKLDLNKNPKLDNFGLTRVKHAGNLIEVMQSSRKLESECPIVRIDKDYYVSKKTGEIKAYKHGENKSELKESVRQSLRRLRDVLNANVTHPKNCKWITLTYHENVRDTVKLRVDFEQFHRQFIKKYAYRENIRYISAVEPQGRGAWHVHLVYIFDHVAPFIPNDDLYQLWGHGWTKTRKLDNVDNIGAYLTAYLGDMEIADAQSAGLEIDENASYKELEIDGKKKRFIKGARLRLYPPKMRIWRCSRNCVRAVVQYVVPAHNAQLKCLFENFVPKFQRQNTYELPEHFGDNGILMPAINVTYKYWHFYVPQNKRFLLRARLVKNAELPFSTDTQLTLKDLPPLDRGYLRKAIHKKKVSHF